MKRLRIKTVSVGEKHLENILAGGGGGIPTTLMFKMMNLKEMAILIKQTQNKDSPEESARMSWSGNPGQFSSTDHLPSTIMAMVLRVHRSATEPPVPLGCHSQSHGSSLSCLVL